MALQFSKFVPVLEGKGSSNVKKNTVSIHSYTSTIRLKVTNYYHKQELPEMG